jgi:hypothetical protein
MRCAVLLLLVAGGTVCHEPHEHKEEIKFSHGDTALNTLRVSDFDEGINEE